MIPIPNVGCEAETVEVTYDFTEIADLIKADPNAPGWTVKQRHRTDPERCDTDSDGLPDFGPAQWCPDGKEYDGATNSCVAASCPSLTNAGIRAAVNDYIEGGGNGQYKEGSRYAKCGLIGTWDVSAVTNMYGLFAESNFNEDISGWDVSNVTDMSVMFSKASDFNQPIGNWKNVSNVTAMEYMFQYASAFNQPIGGWNVSNVTQMSWMFSYASVFSQNISGWCVEQIGSNNYKFDVDSGFENQTGKQPQWNQPCGGSSVSVSSNDSDGDGTPNDRDADIDGDGL
ncbi:MAG: BspA family leucine-rich repeat surface protein, partial [Gammaproteobacteria bacterium]|nr:BspA family leucine-rich repeat surface protein [Gammaproteobacteria bacterium]